MARQSISQVSRQLGISTRTLRYYEQIGLIVSSRKEDFAYRVYDRDTVLRLQQIIVLRKLRIPLSQIADILESRDTAVAIAAFQQNLTDIDDEIAALSTIRSILLSLLQRLDIPNAELQLLDDESLLEIVDSLTLSKINFREDKTVAALNQADETLRRLRPQDYPQFSVAFEIASTDEDRILAFEHYQKAFGAKKISEFSPGGGLHIMMEINGFQILLHPCTEKKATSGMCCQLYFDNEDHLRKAYDLLIQEGQNYSIGASPPYFSMVALVTDKYGIPWWLHT